MYASPGSCQELKNRPLNVSTDAQILQSILSLVHAAGKTDRFELCWRTLLDSCTEQFYSGVRKHFALWNVNYYVFLQGQEMQQFGGPCWWAKCMAFPIPLANSQRVHLPVDLHQLFRTVACSSWSECTRCIVFLPASLNTVGGWLRMGGIVCW